MSLGGLLQRLTRGTRWSWSADEYRAALPADLDQTVMALDAKDRFHAKQGRSTARVRFDSPWGPLSVYLKRHDRLPWSARLAALIHPGGHFSPGAAEWAHLARVKAIGVPVPDAVAVGEQIGPWGQLRSYLLVAELIGCRELNEVLPELARTRTPAEFDRLKRSLVIEAASIAARLHRIKLFHKDFYLCHLFLDLSPTSRPGRRLTLIDLHRLAEHRWTAPRWRWKDLAQLLFSTYGVEGIDDRDRLRFWKHYRRRMSLKFPRWERRVILRKAKRYQSHNR